MTSQQDSKCHLGISQLSTFEFYSFIFLWIGNYWQVPRGIFVVSTNCDRAVNVTLPFSQLFRCEWNYYAEAKMTKVVI